MMFYSMLVNNVHKDAGDSTPSSLLLARVYVPCGSELSKILFNLFYHFYLFILFVLSLLFVLNLSWLANMRYSGSFLEPLVVLKNTVLVKNKVV